MKLKNLLFGIMLSVVFGLTASNIFAAGGGESFSTKTSLRQQKGVVTTLHRTRASAAASVAAANRRGYSAKMSYNIFLRRWVVEINYAGSTSSDNNSTTTTTTVGKAEIGVGCEATLRNAEILYFPSRSMADGIYRAHLRQGDCAKIWNAGSRGWAVAIKAITGRGLRPNRPSKVIGSIKPIQDDATGAGGINSIRKAVASLFAGGAIRPSGV